MNRRLRDFLRYIVERLSESSTWQGLGFILVLMGSKFGAGIDWGAAAALGGLVSGLIKTLFPDVFRCEK